MCTNIQQWEDEYTYKQPDFNTRKNSQFNKTSGLSNETLKTLVDLFFNLFDLWIHKQISIFFLASYQLLFFWTVCIYPLKGKLSIRLSPLRDNTVHVVRHHMLPVSRKLTCLVIVWSVAVLACV